MANEDPPSLSGITIGQPVTEVLESISDAFFALDREWRFTYLNQAAGRLLRRTREELIGRKVWDEFPEAVGTTFDREYRRAVAGQTTVWFEEFFPPLQSWFEVRAYPTPGGLSIYFQDVTERRKIVEELRLTEDRHRALIETMAQGVVFQDAQGTIEYANPAAERILGQPAARLLGMSSADPIWRAVREDGSDLPAPEHPSMIALATGEPVLNVMMGVYNPTLEEIRWICVNSIPLIRGGATRPNHVHTVFEDINDRKQSQEALRRGEHRYRSLVNATSAIVWTTDDHGSMVAPNSSWETYTGQSFTDYEGWGWLEAIHPDDRDRATTAWRKSLAERTPYEFEYRLRRHDGTYRQMISRGVPVLGSSRILREWVGTCEDVTEQREADASLRQAKEEAERASGIKDEFIAVLSHELRTPLTPVLLTVSMMEANPNLPEEFREDVASIRHNVELESRLIGDLLDLTRIAKGMLDLELEPVDIHSAIRMAIEICQRENAIRLVSDFQATRQVVHGDSTRLQQVFWNLINNAQKFTHEGGTIVVRTSDIDGVKLRVEVIDDGVGIDPEVLPRLFDAFEQGDVRASRSFAGLGLGLAISKKLVNAHGGTIDAHSEGKGRGAKFVVELKAMVDASAEPAPSPSKLDQDSSKSRNAMSVLLVEDHDATQRILARLLGRLGHAVTTASSVASALAICTHHEFDLILSDLGLPDGSGLDLMRQLKSGYQGRAVALTGYGMESDIRASREAGFAEHLTKPVDIEILERTIVRIFDRPKGSRHFQAESEPA